MADSRCRRQLRAARADNGVMPRVARSLEPGKLYHVISRFIDRRFELDDELRAIVLSIADRVFSRSDWTLLAYALMTTHMHWTAIAGESPSSEWTRPLNGAIARAVQSVRRRAGTVLGAVFAERPRETIVEGSAAALLAYVHNNPVRAGLVTSAEQSRWTGHRALIGLDEAPGWLDVVRALEVAGFEANADGRAAFHAFVVARAQDKSCDGTPVEHVRSAVRAAAGLPVELRGPRMTTAGALQYEVIAHPACLRRARPVVDPAGLIDAASRRLRIPTELICSATRSQPVLRARRLVVIAGGLAGLRRTDVAAALGIATSTASGLAARPDRDEPLYAHARAILEGKATAESGAVLAKPNSVPEASSSSAKPQVNPARCWRCRTPSPEASSSRGQTTGESGAMLEKPNSVPESVSRFWRGR